MTFEQEGTGYNPADDLGKALPDIWNTVGNNDIPDELRAVELLYDKYINTVEKSSNPLSWMRAANQEGFRDGIRGKNAYMMIRWVEHCGDIGKAMISDTYMSGYNLGRAIRKLYDNQKTEILGGN
jgi:hypothetical protein